MPAHGPRAEVDPVAEADLAAHEESSEAHKALFDLKQDVATAATDAELTSAIDGVEAEVADESAVRAGLDARVLSGEAWGVPAEDYRLTIVGGVPRWAPSAAGPPSGPPTADGLLRTEAGDYLTTEGGDLLLMEA